MMRRIASLNPVSVAALVTFLGVGMFFYANHATDAARVGKPEMTGNALGHVPAVSGMDSRDSLEW
jgi:hypothetical protein